MPSGIDGNFFVTGEMRVDGTFSPPTNAWLTNAMVGTTAAIVRSKLAQEALAEFPINLFTLRVWDAPQTNLPGTAATDDLALVGNTFGTGSPRIEAGDLKAAGATTRYARFMWQLPPEYDAGETIVLRFHAEMVTTVADTSCTLDVECYKSNEEGGIGSDLCATAATSINTLTGADYDFTITPTSLAAGDLFDTRIAITCTDGATGTAVLPTIGAIKLACDIRG